jgi:anaerobic magnesium-protoporphyrin IX monomethyl ester cyclase
MTTVAPIDARAGTGANGRLLLINPKITARRHARFPLSIMTIAAALEDDYESLLIDGNVDEGAVAAACDAVQARRFDAIGVTVMGGPQVATAIEVSRALRAAQPDVPIVWGGYFPTL